MYLIDVSSVKYKYVRYPRIRMFSREAGDISSHRNTRISFVPSVTKTTSKEGQSCETLEKGRKVASFNKGDRPADLFKVAIKGML